MTSPGTITDDAAGQDGGTIAAADIAATIGNLGWDTTDVWDTSTIATLGRPTLKAIPEA